MPERYTRGEPIPVRVRLRWADDGDFDTHATAWTTPLVLIQVDDPSTTTRGVWVPSTDVTRLHPEPSD